MTEKVFYDSPYLTELTSNVIKTKNDSNGFWVLLDKTIFYPEGGGQPADLGTINKISVIDVQEDSEGVWHLLENEIINKSVHSVLNWERRFDHMQQHGGQHIMSGLAYKLFGAHTVGFHLSDTYTTVDLRVEKGVKINTNELEVAVNNLITENRQVTGFFPDRDSLNKLVLRKKPPVDDEIRVVEIDKLDLSACCGTHPSHTGEVGVFKITKTEKIRGDIRLFIVCGQRAVKDYQFKNNILSELIEISSSNEANLLDSIKRVYESEKAKSKEINLLKEELLAFKATEMINNADTINNIKVIKHISSELDAKLIKKLQNIIVKQTNNTLVILASILDKTTISVYYDSDKDVGKVFKQVISNFNGRGGGSKSSAQGGCPNKDDVTAIICNLEQQLTSI